MLDVTQEKKPLKNWKDFVFNLLIASIPASILIVLTREFLGITGAIVPLLFYFGGEMIVGRIRRKKGRIATKKSILWALVANLLFFIVLPVIFIAISDLSS